MDYEDIPNEGESQEPQQGGFVMPEPEAAEDALTYAVFFYFLAVLSMFLFQDFQQRVEC